MRRPIVLLIPMALMLGACFSVAYAPPEMTVDGTGLSGITYSPYAQAVLPLDELSAIGMATGDFGELVTDSTVYAIADVAPSSFVAMRIDPARYHDYVREAQDSEPAWVPPDPPPSHQVYAGLTENGPDARESPPETLCAYFDPRSEVTPPECQRALTVSLGVVTYTAFADEASRKPLSLFIVPSHSLAAAGTLSDIDPRLYYGLDVHRTAYAVDGIDPADLIIVQLGDGSDLRQLVFLADGVQVPQQLCAFLDPEFAADAGSIGKGPEEVSVGTGITMPCVPESSADPSVD